MEIKSNREMIKNDNSDDKISNSLNENKNNIINNENDNDEKNNTGEFINKIKLENNQIKIIDFRNKNDKLYKDINLTTKDTKKLNSKRLPKKKVTILEILEQKMQPLLANNNNNATFDNRSNTNNNNGSIINLNSDNKNKNKSDKILIMKNNDDKIQYNKQNSLKRYNKKNDNYSNKLINSLINSPEMTILSPNHNISSPNTINTNKKIEIIQKKKIKLIKKSLIN